MSKYKKYLYFIGIMLLTAIIVVSGFFLFDECLEQKKQVEDFRELEKIIKVTETEDNQEEQENVDTTEITEENEDAKDGLNVAEDIDLQKLYNINSDLVGWIKIDGTNLNYPVMQNGNFYLRKNFYKNYSSCGTPYLAEYCG